MKSTFTFGEHAAGIKQPSDPNIKFTLSKDKYDEDRLKLSLKDDKNNINSDKRFTIDNQTAMTDADYLVLPIILICASLFTLLVCFAFSVRTVNPQVIATPLWVIPSLVGVLSILSIHWMFRQCSPGGYFCIERRLDRFKETMLCEHYVRIEKNKRIERLQANINRLVDQHKED